MKVLKITREEHGKSYLCALDQIQGVLEDEIYDGETGEKLIIELVEIDEAEFEALEEFWGW